MKKHLQSPIGIAMIERLPWSDLCHRLWSGPGNGCPDPASWHSWSRHLAAGILAKIVIEQPGASWACWEKGSNPRSMVSASLLFSKFHKNTWLPNITHIWNLSWKSSGRCGFSFPSSAGPVGTLGGAQNVCWKPIPCISHAQWPGGTDLDVQRWPKRTEPRL